MDFMNLLKSFDDFIFELLGWLYFYPRTMWLSLVRPSEMMAYADDELDDRPADRYETTISPPLFLLLTMLLTTWLSDAISGPDAIEDIPVFLRQWQNMLVMTAGIFCIYPLVLAITLLRQQGRPISRRTLRPPFYSQCFVASPFALINGVALSLFARDDANSMIAGVAIFFAALLWYFVLQVRWFASELVVSLIRAIWIAGCSILLGFVVSGTIITLVYG